MDDLRTFWAHKGGCHAFAEVSTHASPLGAKLTAAYSSVASIYLSSHGPASFPTLLLLLPYLLLF